jgi:hypothetical protein
MNFRACQRSPNVSIAYKILFIVSVIVPSVKKIKTKISEKLFEINDYVFISLYIYVCV